MQQFASIRFNFCIISISTFICSFTLPHPHTHKHTHTLMLRSHYCRRAINQIRRLARWPPRSCRRWAPQRQCNWVVGAIRIRSESEQTNWVSMKQYMPITRYRHTNAHIHIYRAASACRTAAPRSTRSGHKNWAKQMQMLNAKMQTLLAFHFWLNTMSSSRYLWPDTWLEAAVGPQTDEQVQLNPK